VLFRSLAFEKPILIWGPEYCTAIRAAREYDAAYCVTDPDPAAVLVAMREISKNTQLQDRLAQGARRAKVEKYNNRAVYNTLKVGLESILK
jgi:hypothetical protein